MTDDPAVLPGAEPFSAQRGDRGVLVLHGFTGTPQSVRTVAHALADAGFTVELPRLPGHGTSLDDMATTTWDDWYGAAEAALVDLASRCSRVAVFGLSMGGTLAVALAARHPEVAGIAVVNPAIEPLDPSVVELARDLERKGERIMPGVGNDIADPNQTELAYEGTVIACLLSLAGALEDLQPLLADVRVPTLILNAPQDHVLPPSNSDELAAGVRGPVERVTLERSYHVATLDFDAPLICERVVDFARRVTADQL